MITESRTQEIRTQEVSVLSNLRISGCELKDNCYVSFTQLFKTNFYRYIGISLIFKSHCGFLSLVRVTQFSHFETAILCPKSKERQMEVFFGYFITVKPYI